LFGTHHRYLQSVLERYLLPYVLKGKNFAYPGDFYHYWGKDKAKS
ncbi:MAG: hypothetical protein ACI8RA_003128, partial [Chlamydiales bacterium]